MEVKEIDQFIMEYIQVGVRMLGGYLCVFLRAHVCACMYAGHGGFLPSSDWLIFR
jgi:hypothetical protein